MCLAIPGRIESIDATDPELRMGRVRFGGEGEDGSAGGVLKETCLAYLPEVGVGDWVIVHVGFAISRLDEEEARSVLETLREIGELGAELDQMEAADTGAGP